MFVNIKKFSISALAMLAIAAVSLPGCGANNDPVKEPQATTDKRVEVAKQIRGYFDKSHGNYDSLSPEDKAALDKLTGGEAQSKEGFAHMGAPAK